MRRATQQRLVLAVQLASPVGYPAHRAGYPRQIDQNDLTAIRKDLDMTTTTSYGEWSGLRVTQHETVEGDVRAVLGEDADVYDVPALVAAYREAINAALPDGVTLSGEKFYGPIEPGDDARGIPAGERMQVDLSAIVASVDLWDLVAEQER